MNHIFRKYVKGIKKCIQYRRTRGPFLQRIDRLESILESITLYDRISVNPVQAIWAERWKESRKKVLYIAPIDYSGSIFKWAAAINDYTDWAARIITFKVHRFGYSTDIVIPSNIPSQLKGDFSELGVKLFKLIDEADIIHFKDEHQLFHEIELKSKKSTLLSDIYKRAKESVKPLVFTHYGGYARKYKDNINYKNFVNNFNIKVAMTPDLNFDWFSGSYIPHSIEIKDFPVIWKDGTVVSHSPSGVQRKGTEALVEALSKHPEITLNIIQGLSYEKCLKKKSEATLFFDQAGREKAENIGTNEPIGWYGNSAVEAMAFGIPTIAHLSKNAFNGAVLSGKNIKNSCPVINVDCEDPISIEKAIVNFFSSSVAEKEKKSKQAREWVEIFHSNEVVANELVKLYSKK
ncbi:hypothetical protein [Marispirochaeta sp.]|uniref:glycosyltransferase n=1 Tax=Marispirochaeta sp. TaxID=2038653 RepID=UPI0029C82F96|nr:hypothetical protein [Marispirochaeta sp.]